MNVFGGKGAIVEPEWHLIFDDDLAIGMARGYWKLLRDELETRQLLMPANLHAMKRLTLAYVQYDVASTWVASQGAVIQPNPNNAAAIARPNPYVSIMRDAGIDADRMEAELGLAPRRRASVTKAENGEQKTTGRRPNAYLPQRAGTR